MSLSFAELGRIGAASRWRGLSAEERFWTHVDRTSDPDGHWLWTGAQDGRGYGSVSRGRKAHRVAYELAVGPIPDGHELDHLCRTPLCVNPSHLEPVIHAENTRRATRFAVEHRTSCRAGHPYPPERIESGRHRRRCLECRRQRHRDYMSAYRERRRAAA